MLRRRVIVTEAVAEILGISVWDTPKSPERRSVAYPLPDRHPHSLRHTAASLAISAGANVKVATMLAHKSAAMTLDTYSDLFPDDLDAVAAKLVSCAGVSFSMW